jgi:hypothetical protein
LSAAKASVQQEQQREREQITLLNSLKPRRDLMCLADVVDVDAQTERGGFPFRPTTVEKGAERQDNYHLHVASRPILSPETLVEEPYRPERGRKRQTAEEDEGEATETEESEDAGMDVDGQSQETEVPHRPIRGIRRGVQPVPTARTLPVARSRLLRTTRSAPVGSLQRSVGRLNDGVDEDAMDLEGGLSAWVGRTDF